MTVTTSTSALSHFLATLLFFLLVATGEASPQEDRYCLRCHGMKTLAYQDRATGGVRDLSINPEAMRGSDHAALSCRQCHGSGFDGYPHPLGERRQQLECLSCHENSQTFPRKQFEDAEKSFHRSIHFQSLPDTFTCFSCHDPHTFRALAGVSADGVASLVAQDNSLCLQCHKDQEAIAALSKRSFQSVAENHAWLPEVKRHWQSVRCVECHTQDKRERSHFILGREYAVRDCVACHSQNSILTSKLYQYRSSEERHKAGFIHAVVMNDAYIIGMTRNLWLDWGSISLVAITLLGVTGHGLGRWVMHRKMKNHGNRGEHS